MSENLNIGQLITTLQNRDAVHIAMVPVIAGMLLTPGMKVELIGNKAYQASRSWVGVVDPYLEEFVKGGDKFWLFLKPGSITSLRHEWTHPDFPEVKQDTEVKVDPYPHRKTAPGDLEMAAQLATLDSIRANAEAWLRDFCDKHLADYMTYDQMVKDASDGWGLNTGSNMSMDGQNVPVEFWTNLQIVTGKMFDQSHRDGVYFSCSC